MGDPSLDAVPGYNLYIGGFIALRRPKALANCRITHIVSVLDWHFDDESALIKGFKHLHIPVDDVEDENLLIWFARSNAFIEDGLKAHLPIDRDNLDIPWNDGESVRRPATGPGVLVHCAMGKSRSATVIIAYLLWSSRRAYTKSLSQYQSKLRQQNQLSSSRSGEDNHTSDGTRFTDDEVIPIPPKPLTVEEALTLLRRGRRLAEPNEGFMEQLYLYYDMGCPDDVESHRLYKRWMYRRSVAESLSINRAPEVANVRFEDEEDENDSNITNNSDQPEGKKSLGPGTGVQAPDGTEARNLEPGTEDVQIKCRKCRRLLARKQFIIDHATPSHDQPCAHIFLHPLSWMRPALSDAQLDGRLTCPNPRCAANLGKFAWQGLKCSCGQWVTPGFGVARGRIDEVKINPTAAGGARGSELRMPPTTTTTSGGGPGLAIRGGPPPPPARGGLGKI